MGRRVLGGMWVDVWIRCGRWYDYGVMNGFSMAESYAETQINVYALRRLRRDKCSHSPKIHAMMGIENQVLIEKGNHELYNVLQLSSLHDFLNYMDQPLTQKGLYGFHQGISWLLVVLEACNSHKRCFWYCCSDVYLKDSFAPKHSNPPFPLLP